MFLYTKTRGLIYTEPGEVNQWNRGRALSHNMDIFMHRAGPWEMSDVLQRCIDKARATQAFHGLSSLSVVGKAVKLSGRLPRFFFFFLLSHCHLYIFPCVSWVMDYRA